MSIDSSKADTMHDIDICNLYNLTVIAERGNKIEPFAIFSYFQISLIVIVNGFTLLLLHRTSAGYDKVTQLFFKGLSSTYVCLGLCSITQIACSKIVKMTNVAFKLNYAVSISFLFLSLGFLACINLNRYILIVRPLRYHSFVTIRRARVLVAAIIIVSFSTLINVPITDTFLDHLSEAVKNCDVVTIIELQHRIRPLNAFIISILIAFLMVTTYTNLRTLVIASRLNVRTRNQIRYLASSSANQATGETDAVTSASTQVAVVGEGKTEPILEHNKKESSKTSKMCRATWTVSLITLSLYAAWLPPIVVFICQLIPVFPTKPMVFTIVSLMNGSMWWTPAIYIGTDRKYRQTLKDIFRRKKKSRVLRSY